MIKFKVDINKGRPDSVSRTCDSSQFIRMVEGKFVDSISVSFDAVTENDIEEVINALRLAKWSLRREEHKPNNQ